MKKAALRRLSTSNLDGEGPSGGFQRWCALTEPVRFSADAL
ncbi:hypothetical protein LA76x_2316 [Lysobacter antibioticus]|uniref:Uncharacterized protein n=1 Tax=Lysobacter antibioticus TaxID=84531 RepID=A0A0S2FA91_LYSAN|nr:hypothetical protein LA76x_2316 [Lysobacter antibioticus]